MIDLRSDVLAPPTEEMWAAMRSAELGWATFGEDRSVRVLETLASELLGKEAGLLVPTCGMANLVALMTLARPGTQVVLESSAHIVTSEADGFAAVAGLRACALAGRQGWLDPADVERALAADQGTTLVCLENTHTRAGGTVLTTERTAALADVAHRSGAALHLDGARLFNAAVALGVPVRELAAPADTVAISLNKGLCAPMGAILTGSRAVVEDARLNLRRLGGASIHRAGLVSAAGIVALKTMVDRLAEDHRRAAQLAALIADAPGLRLDPPQTNIVLVAFPPTGATAEDLLGRLAARGVLAFHHSARTLRFVTHRAIGDAEIVRAAEVIRTVAIEAHRAS